MSEKWRDQESARAALNDAASTASMDDVKGLVGKEEQIEEKLKTVPGKFSRMINQIGLLMEMIKDYWTGVYEEVPWATIATAVGAVVYFLSPIDLIPHFIPVVGYIDDAAVVALAIQGIQEDLRTYADAKGHNLSDFFPEGT